VAGGIDVRTARGRVIRTLRRRVARALGRAPTVDDRGWLLGLLPRGAVGAELGVWKGDFSARTLATVHPHTLHLVDPWHFEAGEEYTGAWYGGTLADGQDAMDAIHASVLDRFSDEIARGQVQIHRMPSADAAARFDDEQLDWVYVDGNHLYEYVRADLEAYLPKVRRGGYVTGDDYGDGGWWNGGVKRAVDEFVGSGACELVGIRGRQFVLRRT
jgi:hypothetical protein